MATTAARGHLGRAPRRVREGSGSRHAPGEYTHVLDRAQNALGEVGVLSMLGKPKGGIASGAQVAADESGLNFMGARMVVVHVVDQRRAGTTQGGAGGGRCEQAQGDTGPRDGESNLRRRHNTLHSVVGGEGFRRPLEAGGPQRLIKSNASVDLPPDLGDPCPGWLAEGTIDRHTGLGPSGSTGGERPHE
jgi:hypothetical protein